MAQTDKRLLNRELSPWIAGVLVQASNALWHHYRRFSIGYLTLLFLAPLFAYLPTAALAGIVIVAGFGLLGIAEFRALWHYRRIEFSMGVGTIAAVLVLGMLGGILVAVGLSLLEVVLRASSPERFTFSFFARPEEAA